ncbi:MAG: site-specific DNA-methyltransferase [Candidatus Zixiibacteriota bacterium]
MAYKYIIYDSRELGKLYKIKGLGKCDLIITSPPYYDLKNYANKKRELGHHQSYDEFINEIQGILSQCYGLSKKNATLWLIIDTIRKDGTVYTLPFDIQKALNNSDSKRSWILKDIIIWDKFKNVPWHSKGRFKNQFEYILFFAKNDEYKYNIDNIRELADYKKWWLTFPERYNTNGMPPSNIWQFNPPIRGWGNGSQKHFCPFPFPLVERIISLCSSKGDIVLDPFAGSGTVLAMADVMGRNGIGIDINSEYKKRFTKEVLPGAKRYWVERTRELKEIKLNIKRFSQINAKLRKIKAAASILEYLKHKNKIGGFALVEINNSRVKDICFYILSDSPPSKNDKYKDFVNEIKRVFKINILIRQAPLKDFLRHYFKGKYLYSYSPDCIYSYKSRIDLSQLSTFEWSTDLIYSDIKLQLNRYKDIIKNLDGNST